MNMSEQELSGESPESRNGSPNQKPASGVSAANLGSATRTALVVVGMHRSGTSAMARLLGQTGARLPKNLLPPRSSNQAGFWESKPLVMMHDKMLSEMGSSWDDLSLGPGFWEKKKTLAKYRGAISDLIESEIDGAPFFVLKDPRISRFIPFTVSILEDLGVQPRFVIAIRNPLAVAASLEQRDAFSIAKSLALWLDYSLHAEYQSRNYLRCIVHYERLVEDWRKELEMIAGRLDIPISEWKAEDSRFVDSFITPNLLHHSFPEPALDLWPGMSSSIGAAYRSFLALHRNPDDEGALTRLDELRLSAGDSSHSSRDARPAGPTIKTLYEEMASLHHGAERGTRELFGSAGNSGAGSDLQGIRYSSRTAGSQGPSRKGRDSPGETVTHLAASEGDSEGPIREKVGKLEAARSSLRKQLDAREAEIAEIRKSPLLRIMAGVRGFSRAAAQIRQRFLVFRQLFHFSRTHGFNQARGLIKNRRLIHQSGLFWQDYYLAENDDIRSTLIDPVLHYLLHGGSESRNPNPLFDSAWYLARNPDVAECSFNPLLHYIRFGAAELRDPCPLFSTQWYLSRNPDVAQSGVDPLRHYLMFGAFEGRDPNPLFDSRWYLEQNPDVADAGVNPLVHYMGNGAGEGRDPNPYFESRWYLKTNPDVAATNINPLAHYLQAGSIERRQPSRQFDPRFYLARYRDVEAAGFDPLQHYLRYGRAEGREPIQRPDRLRRMPQHFAGFRRRVAAWKTILVVAHSASEHLFGAERSFLDILDALGALELNLVAVVPRNVSEYTEALRSRAGHVVALEYEWWRASQPVSEATVDSFCNIIEEYGVSAVYVNTIMVREPLLAATRMGVPSTIHVRELIRGDDWLRDQIELSHDEIIERVLGATDFVVANSKATLEAFGDPQGSLVIPNPTDLADFDIPNIPDPDAVRFGLISSNIEKKGIRDFVELARACEHRVPNARFVLIGPETKLTRELLSGDRVPSNLEFPGYQSSCREAIEKTNVVLNFSLFKESFGRTVLEAMAARRPAIVYAWGALPELVSDEETGFLIPYGEPLAAVGIVETLCRDLSRIGEMGRVARERAESNYSKTRYVHMMKRAAQELLKRGRDLPLDGDRQPRVGQRAVNAGLNLESAMEDRDRPLFDPGLSLSAIHAEAAGAATRKHPFEVSVIVPNYNYAAYLPERLSSIFRQTLRPAEIIFLDDMSTDSSVEVARSLLESQDIPFRMISNDARLGPYRNWLKGLSLAQFENIWIAEADDSCLPDFLQTAQRGIQASSNVVIFYSQSAKIDAEGRVMAPDSLHHTDGISRTRWRNDYVQTGVREVVDALAYRNTIPNVSACVIKRAAALEAAALLDRFQFCGDWAFYCRMLRDGDIAFCKRPLNLFRRHEKSQTRSNLRSKAFLQEVAQVREIICKEFPVRSAQLQRMDDFIDRDYPTDLSGRNSQHESVRDILDSAAGYTADRKLIAFITTNNGSWTGGSEVLWREAAMALRKRGHDVVVLIKKWDPAPDFFKNFEAAGIKTYFKGDGAFERVLAHAPDLVIISTGDQDEGTEYYGECIRRGVKYLIVNQLTKEERFWPIRPEKQDAVREGYLNAAGVFFTCRNNHRVMESRLRSGLQRVDYHFNPFHVDRDEFPPFPDGSGGYRIAVPSKLLYIHKGQDLLLEVLKDRKWRRRGILVNVYGAGEDRNRMEETVTEYGIENVRFRGRVADIREIWRENQAFIMPSRMEGMPIMLVSGMLSGRVPIVTNIGGHAELVDDSVTGFIASNPDVESIDDAMGRAWAARDDWAAYGKRARDRVLEFLPNDPVADFIEKAMRVIRTDENTGV